MKAINAGKWVCFIPSLLLACVALILGKVSFSDGWLTALIMLVTAGLGIAAFIKPKSFVLALLSLIAGCAAFIWLVYQAKELYLDVTGGAVNGTIGIAAVILLLAIPLIITAGAAVHLFGVWKVRKTQ